MEDIGNLIDRLNHTEEEKGKAYEKLEYIIEEAVREMLNILYNLYSSLKKTDLTVRNYKGNVYNLGEGIVVYLKGIEEKIILNKEKKLVYYKATNEDFIVRELNSVQLLNEIGFEKIYTNIRQLVKEKIRMNNEQILAYRNQTSKIQKYIKELQQEYNAIAKAGV